MMTNTKVNIRSGSQSGVPEHPREIQVTATGYVSQIPDRCKVVVTITNTKDSVEEVKNSVDRRLEYVLQTLHNHQVKKGNTSISKSLRRKDGVFWMEVEITITFLKQEKCETVCNLLVEKLDDCVKVSDIEFYHSPHKLEDLRKRASLLAVQNAKQKAVAMAEMLQARVGPAIAIQEDACNEWQGNTEETELSVSKQNRIQLLTVHVSVTVTACFQLKSKTKTKKAT